MLRPDYTFEPPCRASEAVFPSLYEEILRNLEVNSESMQDDEAAIAYRDQELAWLVSEALDEDEEGEPALPESLLFRIFTNGRRILQGESASLAACEDKASQSSMVPQQTPDAPATSTAVASAEGRTPSPKRQAIVPCSDVSNGEQTVALPAGQPTEDSLASTVSNTSVLPSFASSCSIDNSSVLEDRFFKQCINTQSGKILEKYECHNKPKTSDGQIKKEETVSKKSTNIPSGSENNSGKQTISAKDVTETEKIYVMGEKEKQPKNINSKKYQNSNIFKVKKPLKKSIADSKIVQINEMEGKTEIERDGRTAVKADEANICGQLVKSEKKCLPSCLAKTNIEKSPGESRVPLPTEIEQAISRAIAKGQLSPASSPQRDSIRKTRSPSPRGSSGNTLEFYKITSSKDEPDYKHIQIASNLYSETWSLTKLGGQGRKSRGGPLYRRPDAELLQLPPREDTKRKGEGVETPGYAVSPPPNTPTRNKLGITFSEPLATYLSDCNTNMTESVSTEVTTSQTAMADPSEQMPSGEPDLVSHSVESVTQNKASATLSVTGADGDKHLKLEKDKLKIKGAQSAPCIPKNSTCIPKIDPQTSLNSHPSVLLKPQEYLGFYSFLKSKKPVRKEVRKPKTKIFKLQRMMTDIGGGGGMTSYPRSGDTEQDEMQPIFPRGREVPPGWMPGQHGSHPITQISAEYEMAAQRPARSKKHVWKKPKNQKRPRRIRLQSCSQSASYSASDSSVISNPPEASEKRKSKFRRRRRQERHIISSSDDMALQKGSEFERKRRFYEHQQRSRSSGHGVGKGNNSRDKRSRQKKLTEQVKFLKTIDDICNAAEEEDNFNYYSPSEELFMTQAEDGDAESVGSSQQIASDLANYYTKKVGIPISNGHPIAHVSEGSNSPTNIHGVRITGTHLHVPSAISSERLKVIRPPSPTNGNWSNFELNGRKNSSSSNIPSSSAKWPELHPDSQAKNARRQMERTLRENLERACAHPEWILPDYRDAWEQLRATYANDKPPPGGNTEEQKSPKLEKGKKVVYKERKGSPSKPEKNPTPKKYLQGKTVKDKSSNFKLSTPKLPSPPTRSEEDTWCYSVNAMLRKAKKAMEESRAARKATHRFPRHNSAAVVSPVIDQKATPSFLKTLLTQDAEELRHQKSTAEASMDVKIQQQQDRIRNAVSKASTQRKNISPGRSFNNSYSAGGNDGRLGCSPAWRSRELLQAPMEPAYLPIQGSARAPKTTFSATRIPRPLDLNNPNNRASNQHSKSSPKQARAAHRRHPNFVSNSGYILDQTLHYFDYPYMTGNSITPLYSDFNTNAIPLYDNKVFQVDTFCLDEESPSEAIVGLCERSITNKACFNDRKTAQLFASLFTNDKNVLKDLNQAGLCLKRADQNSLKGLKGRSHFTDSYECNNGINLNQNAHFEKHGAKKYKNMTAAPCKDSLFQGSVCNNNADAFGNITQRVLVDGLLALDNTHLMAKQVSNFNTMHIADGLEIARHEAETAFLTFLAQQEENVDSSETIDTNDIRSQNLDEPKPCEEEIDTTRPCSAVGSEAEASFLNDTQPRFGNASPGTLHNDIQKICNEIKMASKRDNVQQKKSLRQSRVRHELGLLSSPKASISPSLSLEIQGRKKKMDPGLHKQHAYKELATSHSYFDRSSSLTSTADGKVIHMMSKAQTVDNKINRRLQVNKSHQKRISNPSSSAGDDWETTTVIEINRPTFRQLTERDIASFGDTSCQLNDANGSSVLNETNFDYCMSEINNCDTESHVSAVSVKNLVRCPLERSKLHCGSQNAEGEIFKVSVKDCNAMHKNVNTCTTYWNKHMSPDGQVSMDFDNKNPERITQNQMNPVLFAFGGELTSKADSSGLSYYSQDNVDHQPEDVSQYSNSRDEVLYKKGSQIYGDPEDPDYMHLPGIHYEERDEIQSSSRGDGTGACLTERSLSSTFICSTSSASLPQAPQTELSSWHQPPKKETADKQSKATAKELCQPNNFDQSKVYPSTSERTFITETACSYEEISVEGKRSGSSVVVDILKIGSALEKTSPHKTRTEWDDVKDTQLCEEYSASVTINNRQISSINKEDTNKTSGLTIKPISPDHIPPDEIGPPPPSPQGLSTTSEDSKSGDRAGSSFGSVLTFPSSQAEASNDWQNSRDRLFNVLRSLANACYYTPAFCVRGWRVTDATPLIIKVVYCSSDAQRLKVYRDKGHAHIDLVTAQSVFYTQDFTGAPACLFCVSWLGCGLYTLQNRDHVGEHEFVGRLKLGSLLNHPINTGAPAPRSDHYPLLFLGAPAHSRSSALKAVHMAQDAALHTGRLTALVEHLFYKSSNMPLKKSPVDYTCFDLRRMLQPRPDNKILACMSTKRFGSSDVTSVDPAPDDAILQMLLRRTNDEGIQYLVETFLMQRTHKACEQKANKTLPSALPDNAFATMLVQKLHDASPLISLVSKPPLHQRTTHNKTEPSKQTSPGKESKVQDAKLPDISNPKNSTKRTAASLPRMTSTNQTKKSQHSESWWWRGKPCEESQQKSHPAPEVMVAKAALSKRSSLPPMENKLSSKKQAASERKKTETQPATQDISATSLHDRSGCSSETRNKEDQLTGWDWQNTVLPPPFPDALKRANVLTSVLHKNFARGRFRGVKAKQRKSVYKKKSKKPKHAQKRHDDGDSDSSLTPCSSAISASSSSEDEDGKTSQKKKRQPGSRNSKTYESFDKNMNAFLARRAALPIARLSHDQRKRLEGREIHAHKQLPQHAGVNEISKGICPMRSRRRPLASPLTTPSMSSQNHPDSDSDYDIMSDAEEAREVWNRCFPAVCYSNKKQRWRKVKQPANIDPATVMKQVENGLGGLL